MNNNIENVNGNFGQSDNGQNLNNWSFNNANNSNISNNYEIDNMEIKKVANKCRSISIAYLWMFLLAIIFGIIGGIVVLNYTNPVALGEVSMTTQGNKYLTYVAMLFWVIVLAIIVFVLGIVLTVKTFHLAKLLKGHSGMGGSLGVLFLIGIFIGITGVVAAFMTISLCNTLQENNFRV